MALAKETGFIDFSGSSPKYPLPQVVGSTMFLQPEIGSPLCLFAL